MFDYIRVASALPVLSLGNPDANCTSIVDKISEAEENKCDVVVFPELSLTGYSLGDLFFQRELQNGVLEAIRVIAEKTAVSSVAVAVGAPLVISGRLYNTAVLIEGGKVKGIVPKTFLPDYNEFNEKRWFSSAVSLSVKEIMSTQLGFSDAYSIPVGNDLVFEIAGAKVAIEICEDILAPIPPSIFLAFGGAEVILNLSASNETVAKKHYREDQICSHSAKTMTAYVYSSSGRGESTSDLVYSGGLYIVEKGKIVSSSTDITLEEGVIFADIDLEMIRNDRCKNNTYGDCADLYGANNPVRTVYCSNNESLSCGELYEVKKLPFVPERYKDRMDRCIDIFNIQVEGLRRRLQVTGAKPVIGISGGLDSTLALLVSVEAVKRLNRPVSDVVGITMPCFGTTNRTKSNAVQLMEMLGVTSLEIPIMEACEKHMIDIGHPHDLRDVTYENIQARERTQVLMDYAGRVSGLVVGTGDLSELALGWCTYNADHMSMYGVNGGVPKTLVRWMVVSLAELEDFAVCKDVLLDIADTPISPELLPPDEKGNIAQQTEDLVGPYTLHDFFIFYALRYGFEPKKIFHLACKAFEGDYDKAIIHKWLRSFYRRFFTQQFKRSCQPDGVKVGSIGLSPRGDWNMPSDASFALWIKAVDEIEF